MDDNPEDFNPTGLDHVREAKRRLRRCIDRVANARVMRGRLDGRALDDHHQELTNIEAVVVRAEGAMGD